MKKPFGTFLRFIYENRLGKILRKLINKKWFSFFIGYYCDLRISRIHIKKFIKKYEIDILEIENSPQNYLTFNSFFSRRLKRDARPVDYSEDSIVSPSDGKILAIESISRSFNFPLKESVLTLDKLIGNKFLFEKYINGSLVLLRLAPKDYHRFHFPINCTPSSPVNIPGIYDSVDPIVYQNDVMPLIDNERHMIVLHNKLCRDILMIPIGALCVGRIMETYNPNFQYKKGEEAGYFSFGASSIVLLFENRSIKVKKDIILNSNNNIESDIKMGEIIGHIV